MGEGFAMLASNQAQLFFYQDEAGQGGRRGGGVWVEHMCVRVRLILASAETQRLLNIE